MFYKSRALWFALIFLLMGLLLLSACSNEHVTTKTPTTQAPPVTTTTTQTTTQAPETTSTPITTAVWEGKMQGDIETAHRTDDTYAVYFVFDRADYTCNEYFISKVARASHYIGDEVYLYLPATEADLYEYAVIEAVIRIEPIPTEELWKTKFVYYSDNMDFVIKDGKYGIHFCLVDPYDPMFPYPEEEEARLLYEAFVEAYVDDPSDITQYFYDVFLYADRDELIKYAQADEVFHITFYGKITNH